MGTMSKYNSTTKQPYDVDTPFSELCRFADEYDLVVELDKPFVEFPNILLKVIEKSTGDEIKRITLDDISTLNEEAAKLLNDLSKDK